MKLVCGREACSRGTAAEPQRGFKTFTGRSYLLHGQVEILWPKVVSPWLQVQNNGWVRMLVI